MKPLFVTSATAGTVVRMSLLAWGAGELLAGARRRDRRPGRRLGTDPSGMAIAAGLAVGLIGAMAATHSARKGALLPGGRLWPVVVGLGVFWMGMALRVWSVRTLGRFFTYAVQVTDDHRVVDRGPYRLVRHPSYSAVVVASLGLGVALGNWASLAIAVVPPLLGLLFRIRVEEAALSARLGESYRAYASGRKRLVPGVW